MGSQCSDCKCPNPNEPAVVQLGRALPSDYVAKVISDFAPSEGPVVEKVISEVLALDGSIDLEDPEELAVDLGSTDPANHSCHADGASVASRLSTIPALTIEPELLRGVSMTQCLQHGSRLWLKAPSDWQLEERLALFCSSEPTTEIDVFISHTWTERSSSKFCFLLASHGWPVSLLLWVLAVVLSMTCCILRFLPMPLQRTFIFVSQLEEAPAGFWVLAAGLVAQIIGLYVSPYVPSRAGWGTCFVDFMSINQADEELMQKGIRGIGGFLQHSKVLLILWSPAYLSRLWCVFELAVFRMANPNGKISLVPMVMVKLAVCCFLTMLCAVISTMSVPCLKLDSPNASFRLQVILITIGALPLAVAVHKSRKSISEKQHLVEELANFTLSECLCSKAYVQNNLREELMGWRFRWTTPKPLLLMICLPGIAGSLDVTAGLARAGYPIKDLLTWFCASTVGFATLWTYTWWQVLLRLTDRFFATAQHRSVDILKTLSIYLIFLVMVCSGVVASRAAMERGNLMVGVWCLTALLAAVFSNCC
ncbi:Uncharacterized protein SCF082_LOCUS46531 [Durusdinium trenchii]|uniref:Uncharacterized protein n=1 Tax=Durusdinium trenchii TaxID=1381693 RepID=A0ABP0RG59_9DINO